MPASNEVWIGAETPYPDFTYSYKTNSNLLDHVDSPQIDPYYSYATNRDILIQVNNKIGATSKSAYTYTINDLGQRTDLSVSGTEVSGGWNVEYLYNANGEVAVANHDGG